MRTQVRSLFTDIILFLGGLGVLTKEVFSTILKSKPELKTTIQQIFDIGVRSMPLIITTAFTVGMVITLQSGFGLAKFGGTLYIPRMVTNSILWELGPLFTGLMVAARAGAGMASEIGSMMVTQQVDAMRALGTSPIKKIVVPRVVGSLIALPILVATTNFLCIFGSMVVGYQQFGFDPAFFLHKASTNFRLFDYMSGFSKSFFFALFISLPSCYFGLQVREGAQEVGQATTKAVVVASILIFIGDFFLTKFFWMFA